MDIFESVPELCKNCRRNGHIMVNGKPFKKCGYMETLKDLGKKGDELGGLVLRCGFRTERGEEKQS